MSQIHEFYNFLKAVFQKQLSSKYNTTSHWSLMGLGLLWLKVHTPFNIQIPIQTRMIADHFMKVFVKSQNKIGTCTYHV